MKRNNRLFTEELAGAVAAGETEAPKAGKIGVGVLAGRANRLASIADGSIISRTHELVDPARCRMWAGHNRDYAALNEARCRDLIESLKAQGKQEVPAIVRRVLDDANYDFEVICGARRHWSVSWLRAHNYPDFRLLIEVRELTDEEAFRIADLENRARDDLSDLERARDYLRALQNYYEGRQNVMAERLNVTPTWLSRYLDLARLPEEITSAFADPHELKIRHILAIKPLLKPADRKARVLEAAAQLAEKRGQDSTSVPASVPDVLRHLVATADPPKRSGRTKVAPNKSGREVRSESGVPMLRIDREGRGGVTLTLLTKSGAPRKEVEAAVQAILERHWQSA